MSSGKPKLSYCYGLICGVEVMGRGIKNALDASRKIEMLLLFRELGIT